MKPPTKTNPPLLNLHLCAQNWARRIVNAETLETKRRLAYMISELSDERFVRCVETHVFAQATAQAVHWRN